MHGTRFPPRGRMTCRRPGTSVLDSPPTPSFAFLAPYGPLYLRLATAAERTLTVDPSLTLVALRQLSEAFARHSAARAGLLPDNRDSYANQVDLLRMLEQRGIVRIRSPRSSTCCAGWATAPPHDSSAQGRAQRAAVGLQARVLAPPHLRRRACPQRMEGTDLRPAHRSDGNPARATGGSRPRPRRGGRPQSRRRESQGTARRRGRPPREDASLRQATEAARGE